jgi:uncharacterized delta-60 repeat protein
MRLFAALICLFLFSLSVFAQKLVLDPTFAPTPNGIVSFLEVQSDGKYLIAGEFTTINGTPSFKLARLNTDGSLDTSFNANWLPGPFNQGVGIQMMKLLPNGKILLGGGLPYNGSSGGNVRIFRLNSDGSFDNTLTTIPTLVNENGAFQEIAKADQLPNGKILACGYFTKANNNPKVSLARFNNDGSFDSTFATNIDDITRTTDRCRDVAAQPDGKYLVAGQFDTINGNPGNGLTRFNADDSIDSTFTAATLPNATSMQSLFIKPQSDGSYFAVLSGNVVRLNADGSLRLRLSTNGVALNDVALQTNGKTLMAFDENFSRANTDGSGDPSMANFNFSGNFPADPKAVKVLADGKVIIGGPFTSIYTSSTGSISRPYVARFTLEAIPIKPKFDFDGDGKDDMAVFRPSDRIWYINQSTSGFSSTQFGISTDVPVAADYDGDGKTDIAVWRADGGVWYWLKSSDFTLAYAIVGQPGDIPQQRNPNGRASQIIFRPSTAKWWSFNGFNPPSSFSMGVEQVGDIPVRGDDFDGDGFSELAVYRGGTWIYRRSSGNQIISFQWGLAGDIPVPADYDGDGRSDFAVFRPSDGVWYIYKSNEGFYAVQWGVSGDIPVPADYDGDGKTDIAIYRNGVWYEMRSTNAFHIEQFGLANDIPAQFR